MREFQIVIYGSYGYTGKLVVAECLKNKLNVLLAGRDIEKLRDQSASTGYSFARVDVSDTDQLQKGIGRAAALVHCAGPFKSTALPMAEACLSTGTHYTDITGEYEVFEQLAQLDSRAKEKGIVIMPGTGFDVVPSDCLALHLKNRLPAATHLQLAFAMMKGRVSRGTARTMIEGLGFGGMIRKDGNLVPTQLGEKTATINFGPFTRKTLCIPWGDIATAWRSTGIPNIEVYTAVPDRIASMAGVTKYFNWLLRQRWIKNWLRSKVDSRPSGPGEENLRQGNAFLWGRATDGKTTVEARLKTPNGYLLTAKAATLIASRLSSHENKSGYFTPAQYFGEQLILDVEGTSLHPS